MFPISAFDTYYQSYHFNSLTDTWTNATAPPYAVTMCGFQKLDPQNYLLFGGHNGAAQLTDSWTFSTVTEEWSQTANELPEGKREYLLQHSNVITEPGL